MVNFGGSPVTLLFCNLCHDAASRFYGSVGGMAMAQGNVLPSQQRTSAGFGSVGAAWSPIPSIAVKAQVDGHSPLYKRSGTKEINSPSVQILLGGSFQLPWDTIFDLAVAEDLVIVASAPDVVLHLALRKKF